MEVEDGMNQFLEENVDYKVVTLEEYPDLAAIELLQGEYKGVTVVFDDIRLSMDAENNDQMLNFAFALPNPEHNHLHDSPEFKTHAGDCLMVSIAKCLGEKLPND